MPVLREVVSLFLKAGNPSWRSSVCSCHTKASSPAPRIASRRLERKVGPVYGQPTNSSHPFILNEGEVIPGVSQSEFQERRRRLMHSVTTSGANPLHFEASHIVIIPSATKLNMSDKIPYPFRQNSDFLYLSGCLEPDTVLVLHSSYSHSSSNLSATVSSRSSFWLPHEALSSYDGLHTSTLFVRPSDLSSERWDGPRTSHVDAPSLFGVDEALPTTELSKFLRSIISESLSRNSRSTGKSSVFVWYDYAHPVQPLAHGILRDFLATLPRDTCGASLESPRPHLHRTRLIKSAAERKLMAQSCLIGGEAVAATMRASVLSLQENGIRRSQNSDGDCRTVSLGWVSEHDIWARVDFECRTRGAQRLAYPPVVAGGPRANTIHYVANDQRVPAGQMVLMDAGCEYYGYCSDITRTWPVSGRFTGPQAELYTAVLWVQQRLIQMCRPSETLDPSQKLRSDFTESVHSLDALFHTMCLLLGERLKDLGFLPSSASPDEMSKVAYRYCPHHVSHYLGMDVHDTPAVPRSLPLLPGMVVTVEPGIYVPESDTTAPARYRGMGVRIEDDILIGGWGLEECGSGGSNNDPIILTDSCPRELAAVEELLGA
ncbi:xaa-Pro aminopeptidase 3-like isoform X1 [Ischnura elegans]|uniref:xaa-Pro aminopeptidase 3-like isoform X1 n=1 Tax=Ischnura elegans TaxID=197161 RepID=UPI001ED8926C|nr:xaa-Pro aminopeptidase 3-like isoform X1 [Ischnura elegans]